MSRVLVRQLKNHLGQSVTVKGWIAKIRDLGGIKFLLLRDLSGLVQVVVENETACDLKIETVVCIEGSVAEAPNVIGGVEIHARSLGVISQVDYDLLPFEVNRDTIPAGLDTVLNHRMLSLRNERVRAVFKVQHQIVSAFRDFFSANHFTEIQTPKLVASGTEGGTELFAVEYFNRKAYLAQSPQLYKQMMVGSGLERVYEVGHAYRAELHDTVRHMNEYVSLDVEMGFIEDENDLMTIETEFLKSLFNRLQQQCPEALALFGVELPVIDTIPRLELAEARQILRQQYEKQSPPGNLDPEGERLLSSHVKKEFGSDFVFITKYPVAKRPFYAMPDKGNCELTNSFDLLYKGLEITTGGQRIHSYQYLKENIAKFGLNPDSFGYYLDCFKYGMPPHGGFAIGLERLTMKILGLTNIREATLLPRDRARLEP